MDMGESRPDECTLVRWETLTRSGMLARDEIPARIVPLSASRSHYPQHISGWDPNNNRYVLVG